MPNEFVLDYAQVCQQGGRKYNEDNLGCFSSGGDSWLFVVADGLGGHAHGELASQKVIEAAEAQASNGLRLEKGFMQAIVDAAAASMAQDDEASGTGMASTAVILAVADGRAFWGHVGDSRLYLFRAGTVAARSKDHSLVQTLIDDGEISEQEALKHPQRSRLLMAIGGDARARVRCLHPVTELLAGDAFVLASDGFWEYLTDQQMLDCLAHTSSAQDYLDAMLACHRQQLQAEGISNNDNYTAIVLRVNS